MNIPLVLSDDDGIRPAGEPNKCFYCQQRVGQPHKEDCVTLLRKVKIRYIFEIEIESPYSWTKEEIEDHRNNSSWCASNAIKDIEAYGDQESGCLCGLLTTEVIEMDDADPYRRNKAGEIVP